MLLNVVDHAVKTVQAFCGLRVEVNVALEVELLLHILHVLHHNSPTLCLTDKSEHLGMTVLSKNHNLRIGVSIKLSLDPTLQLQHHRTGSIDDVDVVSFCQSVCFGRLTVSTQQHLHIA